MPAGGPTGPAPRSTPRATSRAPCYVDWRADLVDDARRRRRDPTGRPGPGRGRRRPGRHRRRDARSSSTTTPRASMPRGCGGRSGRTGSSTSAILDGGFPAWEAEGRAESTRWSGGRRLRRRAPFTPRGPNRMHLTTVRCPRAARGARRDPARCARPGRVPRIRGQHPSAGPHPGRRQRPGRDDARGGQPAPAPGRRAPRSAPRRERQPRPPDGGLRRVRGSPPRSWPSS